MSEKLKKLEDVNAKIERLHNEKRILSEEYLKEICPLNIGDKTEVKGHSHRGKKMQVVSVYLVENFKGEFTWKAVGKIVKKDGSLSVGFRGNVSQLNYKL